MACLNWIRLPPQKVIQALSNSLRFAATNAFLQTTVNIAPLMVEPHKIVGMTRNIMIQGDICN